jgi:hypothetical protein
MLLVGEGFRGFEVHGEFCKCVFAFSLMLYAAWKASSEGCRYDDVSMFLLQLEAHKTLYLFKWLSLLVVGSGKLALLFSVCIIIKFTLLSAVSLTNCFQIWEVYLLCFSEEASVIAWLLMVCSLIGVMHYACTW